MTQDDLFAMHRHFSARSLQYYLDNVTINSSPKPAPWGTIREWWQDEALALKLGAFENLMGQRPGPYTGPRSFFDILARGHDKSSMEGRLATGALIGSRRPIQGYIVAADKDQAALLKQAMKEESDLNPWVADQLNYTKDAVEGPNGTVEIVPADAGGSYGFRGNLFIFDELCNWDKPICKKVYDAVMSGTEKRDPRIVVIISNAGYFGSWQETVWKEALTDPDWACFYKEGQLASWMTPERVEALAKKLSSKSEAKRLFHNLWIAPGEDKDYLTLDECKRCVNDNLFYRISRAPAIPRIEYTAAIDYGPKRDRTVLVVGHVDTSGRSIVDKMDVMQGSPEAPVQPSRIRQWIVDVEKRFDPVEYVLDPYGLNSEIEWLQANRYPIFEYVSRGGKAQYELAQVLRSQITSGGVHWYPGCGDLGQGDTFEKELSLLVTKKKAYGFRIDHDSTAHDDRAVALGMLLVRMTGMVE